MRNILRTVIYIAAICWGFSFAACTDAQKRSEHPTSGGDSRTPRGTDEWFVDVAAQAGLNVVHRNGMSGQYYQPEIMTPGVGLFDYDGDGDLDAYLSQGGSLEQNESDGAENHRAPGQDRLYRNDLTVSEDGSQSVRFTDVTAMSGIKTRGYGTGVTTGDIDNDGDIDLYATGLGRNQMFRNNNDGTFTDITVESGTDDPDSWSVSAAFLDFDRDGWLDLFVGNYLNFNMATHIACVGISGLADYCRPSAYRPQLSRLYRNQGNGQFVDVTVASGLAREFGPALGVSTADFNGDGWIDIFVANDEQENQLWINQRNGTFINTALLAGVALGTTGTRKADMGVDAGDFDADGDEDLFITELTSQGSTLYVNDGSGTFEDQSDTRGIRLASLPYTGFGTAWFDFDNDGWLDLLAVNGYVHQNAETVTKTSNPFPFGQQNQLFKNIGGQFTDVTHLAGTHFDLVEVSRGAAFGDVDNDGDTDVLIGNGAGPVRLMQNHLGEHNHWVGLRLVAQTETGALHDILGARVAVVRANAETLWRRARTDGSYASANAPRVLVGLGDSTTITQIRVVWPNGRSETWPSVPLDQYTTLIEGTGANVQ